MNSQITTGCQPSATQEASFSSLNEIDRVGMAFAKEAQNIQRVSDVQNYRTFRMRCLSTTLSILDACKVPERSAVSARLKRLDSIRRKIGRATGNFKLGRLDDVIGVRVICENLGDVGELSSRIQDSPEFFRLKDYLDEPAPTGYRGIHHIMKFDQPVTEDICLSMRFEIQVRTYLQHQWAIWSESHGEATKAGLGSSDEQRNLLSLSERFAEWENSNPETSLTQLPSHTCGKTITVCWRTENGSVIFYPFQDDAVGAAGWLNFLETSYPGERENGLLLVGVESRTSIDELLKLTHPLYTGSRVANPGSLIEEITNSSC
ncbi:MAG: RelA/SpoT domain-containing protein [Gammaproteobacteria bacterium]|nr:RelA/SpoT domain-containing protein [Gammaproteobacteria bacterium]